MTADKKQPTNYVQTLSDKQMETLRNELEQANWQFDSLDHARWRARREKTTVVAYNSGKLVVQGKGTADLVQFILEPKVLGEARLGYEEVLARKEDPAQFEAHAGIDESGKGDFFGPLVIAAVGVTADSAQALIEAGVMDSKRIKSDRRIAALAEAVRNRTGDSWAIVPIGPDAYNRLYAKIGNVNRLLAWGHARALENLLERQPDCPRALSDQFGNKETVKRALLQHGRSIELEQRTKAESDIAVAAASILARHEFVRRLETLGEPLGVTLPKGAGIQVRETAVEIVRRHGEHTLRTLAKTHFKTYAQVLEEANT
ncbi:MAG: ribonuclease HIII [Verrucomicrobiota bacterium]